MARFSPNIIANYLTAYSQYNPQGEVVVHGDLPLDWYALTNRIFKLAQALAHYGICKGDKVAFVYHNCPTFIEVNFAAQVLGAIPVPINFRFSPAELENQISHSDARVVFFDSIWEKNVIKAKEQLHSVELWIRSGPTDKKIEGVLDYETLLSSYESKDPQIPTAPNDVAVMIYTGGTTGRPKGVLLTYGAYLDMFANLFATIMSRGVQLELTPAQEERALETFPLPGIKYLLPFLRTSLVRGILASQTTKRIFEQALRYLLPRPEVLRLAHGSTIRFFSPSMPFFHIASYQMLFLGLMVGNMCFILLPQVSFDAEIVLQTIEREKPFFMANVPAGWKRIVTCPTFSSYDTSSIRVGATGAGACTVDLKRTMMERFPEIIIVDMLGQTEMTPLTAIKIDTNPFSLKERSVGQSIVEARIVDKQGRDLPPGEVGEIWYRSSTIMKGYYKDEQSTRQVTKDGWFLSGDLGYFDEEGEIRLLDRKGECINSGGEKIYPLEVEEHINTHPKVEQTCVFGVSNKEWGELPRAVIQLKKGEQVSVDSLIEFCKKTLAGYKVPRSIIFVDQLPLSPAGKVLRAKIKECYSQ